MVASHRFISPPVLAGVGTLPPGRAACGHPSSEAGLFHCLRSQSPSCLSCLPTGCARLGAVILHSVAFDANMKGHRGRDEVGR